MEYGLVLSKGGSMTTELWVMGADGRGPRRAGRPAITAKGGEKERWRERRGDVKKRLSKNPSGLSPQAHVEKFDGGEHTHGDT